MLWKSDVYCQNSPKFISLWVVLMVTWIGRESGGPLSAWKHVPHLGYCVLSHFTHRLIGTATVSLKDLIGDQNRSLPYKLISLLNERGQETGVSTFCLIEWLWTEISKQKFIKKSVTLGTPRWLSPLSVCLLISAEAMISWFVGSSPASGSALTVRNLLGILSPSLSLPLPCCSLSLCLSLSQNK